jgi:hypothetical protein
LSEGHADAPFYPIGMLWDESSLAVDRINGFHATQAVLTRMAVQAVLSKDGSKEFNKTVKRLSDSGD